MTNSSTDKLRCTVVTPTGPTVDQSADLVVFTAHDGQFGILPGREPLLCQLVPGPIKIVNNNQAEFYFVAGGFAEVFDNVVTIVTPKIIPADHLTPATVENELKRIRTLPNRTESQRRQYESALSTTQQKLTQPPTNN